MATGFTAGHHGGSGSPLVCLHGFTDTWRTWELILPMLEQRHEVFALTLPGHAGGPPLPDPLTDEAIDTALERMLDDVGVAEAHLVGNSLGGYLALRLAARGRATSVVALAPAGGTQDDPAAQRTLDYFVRMNELVQAAAPRADEIVATAEGRRRASEAITVNFEHIPPDLLAHQIRGAAACHGMLPLVEHARSSGWTVGPAPINCSLRFVWGTEDRLLPWPAAAQRYRDRFAQADWVTLDGVGHCPQLDVPAQTAQQILSFTGA